MSGAYQARTPLVEMIVSHINGWFMQHYSWNICIPLPITLIQEYKLPTMHRLLGQCVKQMFQYTDIFWPWRCFLPKNIEINEIKIMIKLTYSALWLWGFLTIFLGNVPRWRLSFPGPSIREVRVIFQPATQFHRSLEVVWKLEHKYFCIYPVNTSKVPLKKKKQFHAVCKPEIKFTTWRNN